MLYADRHIIYHFSIILMIIVLIILQKLFINFRLIIYFTGIMFLTSLISQNIISGQIASCIGTLDKYFKICMNLAVLNKKWM